jgi:hypothetical protein
MRHTTRALLALLALAACGPSIRVTANPSLPIPEHARYAWGRADGPPSPAERHPRAEDPSLRAMIERAVDRELQGKGFVRTVADSATFLVHYHLGITTTIDTLRERKDDCQSPPCRATDWGYWGRPELTEREVEYTDGSLMLDVMHRASGALAWRALGRGDATPSRTTADRERRVGDGVARLLRDFPHTRK